MASANNYNVHFNNKTLIVDLFYYPVTVGKGVSVTVWSIPSWFTPAANSHAAAVVSNSSSQIPGVEIYTDGVAVYVVSHSLALSAAQVSGQLVLLQA